MSSFKYFLKQPIIKNRLNTPKAGYNSLIKLEKPIKVKGRETKVISKREFVYEIFTECCNALDKLYKSPISVENISSQIIIVNAKGSRFP